MRDMKKIGAEAKKLRVRHGVSQKDIAGLLGYGTTNISSFERGLNRNAVILLYYMENFGLNPLEVS